MTPPTGTGNSAAKFYAAERDMIKAWLKVLRQGDTLTDVATEVERVTTLYERALASTQRAFVAASTLENTAVFPSEDALNAAVAAQSSTSKKQATALNRAQLALIRFADDAGFTCS